MYLRGRVAERIPDAEHETIEKVLCYFLEKDGVVTGEM
jgi:hypothetical protein